MVLNSCLRFTSALCALVLSAALFGCSDNLGTSGDGQSTTSEMGSTLVTVRPQATPVGGVEDIDHIDVGIVGVTDTPITLTKGNNNSWSGLLTSIPVGNQTFIAQAYNATGDVIFIGTAETPITAGAQNSVVLILKPRGDGGSSDQHAPSIGSISASVSTVTPGGSVQLTLSATDPDNGDTLTFAWSSDAGTFADATAKNALWTAPNTEGVQRLTITVTDSTNLTDTAFIDINVANNVDVSVDVKFDTISVTSFTATPAFVPAGTTTRIALAAVADSPTYTFSVDSDNDPNNTNECPGTFTPVTNTPNETDFTPDVSAVGKSCIISANITDSSNNKLTATLTLNTNIIKATVPATVRVDSPVTFVLDHSLPAAVRSAGNGFDVAIALVTKFVQGQDTIFYGGTAISGGHPALVGTGQTSVTFNLTDDTNHPLSANTQPLVWSIDVIHQGDTFNAITQTYPQGIIQHLDIDVPQNSVLSLSDTVSIANLGTGTGTSLTRDQDVNVNVNYTDLQPGRQIVATLWGTVPGEFKPGSTTELQEYLLGGTYIGGGSCSKPATALSQCFFQGNGTASFALTVGAFDQDPIVANRKFEKATKFFYRVDVYNTLADPSTDAALVGSKSAEFDNGVSTPVAELSVNGTALDVAVLTQAQIDGFFLTSPPYPVSLNINTLGQDMDVVISLFAAKPAAAGSGLEPDFTKFIGGGGNPGSNDPGSVNRVDSLPPVFGGRFPVNTSSAETKNFKILIPTGLDDPSRTTDPKLASFVGDAFLTAYLVPTGGTDQTPGAIFLGNQLIKARPMTIEIIDLGAQSIKQDGTLSPGIQVKYDTVGYSNINLSLTLCHGVNCATAYSGKTVLLPAAGTATDSPTITKLDLFDTNTLPPIGSTDYSISASLVPAGLPDATAWKSTINSASKANVTVTTN